MGRQRNCVIFSHDRSCYPWLFAANQHPHLKATALTCHGAKSIALIPENNRGLCPQRQIHFSLSRKPMLHFQVHVNYSHNTEHVLELK